MRKSILLVAAFGLVVSATADTGPDANEPCECEIENPCYQAVYGLSSSICGSYATLEIPAACNGDKTALQNVCDCLSVRTVVDGMGTKTQALAKNTNSKATGIASTTNAQQAYDSAPATYATAGNDVSEPGSLTAHTYDSAMATGSIPPVVYTRPGPQNSAPSVPADHEVGSTGTSTTTLANSHIEETPGHTFTTYVVADSSLGVVTTGASSPSTTHVVYPTRTKSHSKCHGDVKNCGIGSDGLYKVTETDATSDNVYPISTTIAETSIDHLYTTETVWSTEIYLVTESALSAESCTRGSTAMTTYPVTTTAYLVPKALPSGSSDYVYTARSTTYITETVYYTTIHTISRDSSYDCVHNPSTTWTSPSSPTSPTSFEQSFDYATSVTAERQKAPDEPYYPTGHEKPYAPPPVLVRSQPSAVTPYSRPGGAGQGSEVTAGTTRLSVQIEVAAVLGILAALLS